MLLYQAVLEHTLGMDHRRVRAYLLYTRYPLLYPARPSWAMVRRAIDLRNRNRSCRVCRATAQRPRLHGSPAGHHRLGHPQRTRPDRTAVARLPGTSHRLPRRPPCKPTAAGEGLLLHALQLRGQGAVHSQVGRRGPRGGAQEPQPCGLPRWRRSERRARYSTACASPTTMPPTPNAPC